MNIDKRQSKVHVAAHQDGIRGIQGVNGEQPIESEYATALAFISIIR